MEIFTQSTPLKIKLSDKEIKILEEICETNPEQARKASVILKLNSKISQRTIAKEEGVNKRYINFLQTLFLSNGMDMFKKSNLRKLTNEEILKLEEICRTNPKQAKKANVILKLNCGISQKSVAEEVGISQSRIFQYKKDFELKDMSMFNEIKTNKTDLGNISFKLSEEDFSMIDIILHQGNEELKTKARILLKLDSGANEEEIECEEYVSKEYIQSVRNDFLQEKELN